MCWNPWGLCNERLNYCRSMDIDIQGLTELHNVHNKKQWRGKHWITSADAEVDDQGNCVDSASGVGILLSKRFSSKILTYSLSNYLQIGVLGYADDAALISKSADLMSKRLNKVSKGSREDADMYLNTDKTKVMHVERQQELPAPTQEQIKSVEDDYKNECEFCDKKFKTERDMRIHKSSCNYK